MPGPLKGIRVIDLSRIVVGPYCSMVLGDMGADVIKIEMPKIGDDTRMWGPPFAGGESAYYISLNRNKRSITLNLKSEKGKEILRQLIAEADVLIENFRMGTLEKMGFGYEPVKKLNPKIIYCSITGYGKVGPYADEGGVDIVVAAESGLTGITGHRRSDSIVCTGRYFERPLSQGKDRQRPIYRSFSLSVPGGHPV